MTAGIITAQFVTDNDPLSIAIRDLSDGLYSHVDLVLPEGLLGAHIEDGVKIRPFDYAKWTLRTSVHVAVPDVDKANTFARAQVGKLYNDGAILDMFLHRMRKFVSDQNKWFCDELLYAIVAQGGLELLNTDNPLVLTPWQVYLSPYWTKENQ